MEHDGCKGCKYEKRSADSKECQGCKQNAVDKYTRMTNADRIRSMSDEELAAFIVGLNNHCLAGIGLCDCSKEEDTTCEQICMRKTRECLQSEVEK